MKFASPHRRSSGSFIEAKAGFDSTVAAASAMSRRLMAISSFGAGSAVCLARARSTDGGDGGRRHLL
jgi:hypothetical protein